jgi:hypothetical protein
MTAGSEAGASGGATAPGPMSKGLSVGVGRILIKGGTMLPMNDSVGNFARGDG